MQIDEDLIFRLEQLTRLELDAAERQELLSDLNHILELVEQMNRLDTTGVPPLAYVNVASTPLREDVVGAQVTPEQALRDAPDTAGHCFKVPKVIDL